ncbi:glycine cleavage system aminomethyltransferase GcvT [Candidatus Bathyarchaeota archaeon]|nr:glycine cleavage system aminomethyltransferase GcvT [Candidatus Bathyarchaeota archaeon]
MGKTRRTQLHEVHRESAKLTRFAGFELPLLYKGVILEHMAVRNSVGIFDISHMGRVSVTGADSESFLNYVITNDASALASNGAEYSVMCDRNGGILDDFVVYRQEAERFMVVFNASNREKDYNWLIENAASYDVKIEDISGNVAMLAVQGPRAESVIQRISKADLSEIGRFKCRQLRLADIEVFVSRTGYTGEDGFEIFVWNTPLADPKKATRLWGTILEAGRPFGIEPCGLGARDTLRLEAGLCLYGNDIDETTTPLEARLGFVVKFQKDDFIGKDALLEQKNAGVRRRRVGIQMMEKGIPRQGFRIYNDANKEIGCMTSGTFSPLLKSGIGMAYIRADEAKKGNLVRVEIRNRLVEGEIVSFPFYDTGKYGFRRKI